MKPAIRLIRDLMVWLKYRKLKFANVGSDCHYQSLSSSFAHPEGISLSDDVHIGPGCKVDGTGGVCIGRGTILAPDVHIYTRTHNFDHNPTALPFDNIMLTAPVHIGEFVWIGARVTILPGVTIGDGAVIGAGAVISRDLPPCAVAVGNPAKIVHYRDKATFDHLCESQQPFVYKKHGHGKIFMPKGRP